jgi:hypothetical protein
MKIAENEATFQVRGFHEGSPVARHDLETHGKSFVQGFNWALIAAGPEGFAELATELPIEEQGFAYEGAAMAFGIFDLLTPRGGRRIEQLLQGTGAPHVYMVHVGAGWAMARLRRGTESKIRGLDPLLRWLCIDGYGFHEGFFKTGKFALRQQRPQKLKGYTLRVFDQGLGRCLWFVEGGDCERLAATVSGFAPSRQSDLWSGVGLAATYAGGVELDDLEVLAARSHKFRPAVAQGAAFAAKARLRAGNLIPQTEMACRVLCAMSAQEAADVTDAALEEIPTYQFGRIEIGHDHPPAYEVWRQRTQARWATALGTTATSPTCRPTPAG